MLLTSHYWPYAFELQTVKYQCYDLLLPVVINDDRHFIMLLQDRTMYLIWNAYNKHKTVRACIKHFMVNFAQLSETKIFLRLLWRATKALTVCPWPINKSVVLNVRCHYMRYLQRADTCCFTYRRHFALVYWITREISRIKS